MNRLVLSSLMMALLFTLTACVPGGPKIDPAAYQLTPADSEKIDIVDVCRSAYKTDIPRVAIVSFQNNTTYGKMTATNTNTTGSSETTKKSAAVVGFVASPVGVGIGGASVSNTKTKYSSNVETFMREIAPNIGEYAQSAVENTVAVMGGMEIFDRTNLQKIMAEQKFQMTLGDPNTAVKLGKLAGVQYIITGTVDNINAKYREATKNNSNAGGWLGVAMAAATAAANTQSGWNVTVEMTVKLIDVTTGQVIINKKVDGREIGGSQRAFNPEMVITAAKKAMGEAVDDIKPEFSSRFAQQGYIQQLRGGKQVALINLGSKLGIKPGTELVIMDFSEIVDPFTNAKTCNQAKIPVDVVVSDQVQENQAWVQITGKPEQLVRVKLGSIVRRKEMSGQSVFKKMF